jgi:hypothetical protein
VNAAAVLVGSDILVDDVADEISGSCLIWDSHII